MGSAPQGSSPANLKGRGRGEKAAGAMGVLHGEHVRVDFLGKWSKRTLRGVVPKFEIGGFAHDPLSPLIAHPGFQRHDEPLRSWFGTWQPGSQIAEHWIAFYVSEDIPQGCLIQPERRRDCLV